MTDNNNKLENEPSEYAELSPMVTNTTNGSGEKSSLKTGGMYRGLKISPKAANIAATISVIILIVVIIFAVATADGHTVSFDSNGGTDVESFQVEYGVYGEIDAVPTREGYTFDGWYLDESLTIEYNPEGTIESDLTLYAKWVAN